LSTLRNWFAVKCWLPDVAVARRIERLGFSTFRPERHVYSRKHGRETMRATSLMPGYVFVGAVEAQDAFRAAQATGVAYLLGNRVGDAFAPAQIPSQWVEALRDAGPAVEGKAIAFKKGENAKVALGKLVEIIGEFERFDETGKAVLNVILFGTQRSVHVPAEHLERAG